MMLQDVIKILKEEPNQDLVVPMGFDNPHSYRGYYEQLAFEPQENVTIGQMLSAAESALGKTFEGYKGGSYTMSAYTDCWLADYGDCGEELGPVLLNYMIGRYERVPKEFFEEPVAHVGHDYVKDEAIHFTTSEILFLLENSVRRKTEAGLGFIRLVKSIVRSNNDVNA